MAEKPPKLHWKKYVQQNAMRFAHLAHTLTIKPISASLPHATFGWLLGDAGLGDLIKAGLAVGRRKVNLLRSLYSVGCWECCERLDEWAHQRKLSRMLTPVKVVFDAGCEHQSALERGYKAFYQEKADTYLCKVPSFESDDEIRPLQAAHLYAWLLSRSHHGKRDEDKALEIIHARL